MLLYNHNMGDPESRKPRKTIPYHTSVFERIANYLKLFWRLLLDRRVSLLLKLIPVCALIYVISPLDWIIPVIDDLVIACLGIYLFVELCPPEIVSEHRKSIEFVLDGEWRDAGRNERRSVPDEPPIDEQDIIEGEFHEKH
jgi:uncharacterized membrane protein YkvA (DUF1232 family)